MKYSAAILAVALLFTLGCDRPDFGTRAKTGDVVETDVDREAPDDGAGSENDPETGNNFNETPGDPSSNNDSPPAEGPDLGAGASFGSIVDANAEFGFSAYAAQADGTGSFVVGAYGLTRAAAVASLGASGTARATLEEKSAEGLFGDELHNAFNALDLDLTTRDSMSRLDLVAGTWVPQGAQVRQAFVDDISRYYGLSLRRAEFETRPEDARVSINNFYREQTSGELTDVVPARAIGLDTSFLVTDGNVFRGTFEDAFDPQYTSMASFDGRSGTREVPMMLREGTVMGVTRDGFRAVELPFDGGFSILLVLPDEGLFEQVEAQFDAAFVDDVLSGMAPGYLVMGVPRVSVNGRVDAFEDGAELGLDPVFDSDFSSVYPDARLSNIVQRTRISLVEEGVNADPVMLPPLDEEEARAADVPSIFFSRSFLFVVRDTQTGTILFIGRVD